jgi:hypothetical protein
VRNYSPLQRVPLGLLQEQITYVMSAGGWQRFVRSLRAAWRCSRAARKKLEAS